MGYLFTAAPPDLERGVAPLGPPAPMQPPLLGHGVAPPGHGSLALSVATPDLGRGVASLGCASTQSVAATAILRAKAKTIPVWM